MKAKLIEAAALCEIINDMRITAKAEEGVGSDTFKALTAFLAIIDAAPGANAFDLPVHFGDTVYLVKREWKNPPRVGAGRVTGIELSEDYRVIVDCKHQGKGLLGDTVFKSKTEAEEYLRKRNAEEGK